MAAAAGEVSGAELPGGCRGADSGNVSQSHSSASGLGEPDDEDALEASLSATAAAYSAYLLADRSLFSEEIRTDSSQVVNESLPQIYTKATEMRHIYRKIDKLEAFVKMIGNSVAGLEERVIKAETDLGAFPNTFKKILHTISIPAFLNVNFAPSSSLVNTRQGKVQYCRTSVITKDVDSLERNRLPHDNNRPPMNLRSSSRLKTISHVLMKHLIDDFCFGIDMNHPE
ncbi:Bloc1s4 [Columba livia]|nr:Bloc1s4 [Columba livia]